MAAVMEGIYLNRLGYSYPGAVRLFGHDPSIVHFYIGSGSASSTLSVDCKTGAGGAPAECSPGVP